MCRATCHIKGQPKEAGRVNYLHIWREVSQRKAPEVCTKGHRAQAVPEVPEGHRFCWGYRRLELPQAGPANSLTASHAE